MKTAKKKRGAQSEDHFHCSYGEYGGEKRWDVKHPDYESAIVVAAPNADSAIVAAASFWGRDWTRIAFYAHCSVLPHVAEATGK